MPELVNIVKVTPGEQSTDGKQQGNHGLTNYLQAEVFGVSQNCSKYIKVRLKTFGKYSKSKSSWQDVS